MPKVTRKFVQVTDETQYQEEFNETPEGCSNMSYNETFASESESQEDLNATHESSSDQEVVFNSKPSTSKKVHHSRSRSVHMPTQQQAYMPYIEGPKMNWNVDDDLYNRFIKWKIRCENILDCELSMLSEARKCKKVITWSGDFGLDQYISWNLSNEELCLDTIWQKYEEFL